MPPDDAASNDLLEGCHNQAETPNGLEEDASTEDSEQANDIQALLYDLWSHDEEIVASAVGELSDLTDFSHPERKYNRQKVFDAGGHFFIFVNIMKSIDYENRPEIIQESFGILVDLIDNFKRCKSVAKHPDAIKLCVRTMTKFSNREDVCGNVMCLMSDLCRSSDDFKISAVREGFVPIVIESMVNFSQDEYFQQVAISVMHQLLKSEKRYNHIRRAIQDADSLPVLATAKRKFGNNEKIQKRVQSCMQQLSVSGFQASSLLDDVITFCCKPLEVVEPYETKADFECRGRRRRRSFSPRGRNKQNPRQRMGPVSHEGSSYSD